MENYFGNKILAYKEDILDACREIIKIPSVVDFDKSSKEMPFGPEAYKALEWILNKAKQLGFTTKMCSSNKAGYAEYGEGKDYVAVVAHVDIVPAGNEWDTNPFELIEKDGRYYARGIADDKGSCVVALYCLKALKDSGVIGKHRIRCIFGSGEEVNSDDISSYFDEEPYPIMSFTPDSDYGLCNAEKGIFRVKISENGKPYTVVKEFKAGNAANSVPDRAFAVVECSDVEFKNLTENIKKSDNKFECKRTADCIEITSFGKSSHAMEPHKGINAACTLINLLVDSFGEHKVGKFYSFVNKYIGFETDGASLGIKCQDEISGGLTVNLGLINIKNGTCNLTLDMRSPVTFDIKDIYNKLENTIASLDSISVKLSDTVAPLYQSKDSELIKRLSKSYKTVTGKDIEIYSCGGGTYARSLAGTGVAFGPSFSDNSIHEKNENVLADEFWLHSEICLQAMYDLMKG